ncbi:MAG: proteasome accessory factor PafA2 family protein [Candidatus Eisenbacteria bacterium]
MSSLLMGVETEYALSGFDAGGAGLSPATLAEKLLKNAFARLTGIPTHHGRGLFLENGGLFYIDCGSHPEFCTPECEDPIEVVRYIRAGERTMRDLAESLRAGDRALHRTFVTRCNVDYSGSKNTWGCNESYGYRCRPVQMAEQLLPHLVSRIVYTGAGGFDPYSPGIVFSLSPRVFFLERKRSEDSTRTRGIVHRKNEPLCEGYNRLHLVCGESLCSDVASWLKIGTTALVVAMIDQGILPAAGMNLSFPYRAMKAFSKDPACRASVSVNGGRETAISIQRRYLEAAEARLGGSFLPPWAEEVCKKWRAVLNDLEEDPSRVSGSLDWAIKKNLYDHRARLAGVDPAFYAVWNAVVPRLMSAVRRSPLRGKRVTVEEVLGRHTPIAVQEVIKRMTPLLERNGRSWDELRPLVDLRKELLEIDTRFSELSDDGIFEALDRAGVLRHRLVSPGEVERAVKSPPERGRARIRGKAVRQLACEGRGHYLCDWDHLIDVQKNRVLDLSDPFAESEEWKPLADRLRLRERIFPF